MEWGSPFKCDMPVNAAQAVLEYIRDTIQPDLVIWTGDNSAHSIWDISQHNVIQSTIDVSIMMSSVFTANGIPVFPAIANHDVFPVNQ